MPHLFVARIQKQIALLPQWTAALCTELVFQQLRGSAHMRATQLQFTELLHRKPICFDGPYRESEI